MYYPTSRKKYYLRTEIKPQWLDSDLPSELHKHVTSKTNQQVRDIFIPHSERIGFFSVRNREIAEKLVKSFASNYISSGRKSDTEIKQVSQNNFQIKVTNINNIMNSNEFESWVLSLNYSSFDIQLMPPEIMAPSSECIFSFDTVGSAVFVKQKLENVQFRGFPLYFTHWHVPRRSASTLGDSNSQCSSTGYSTSTGSEAQHLRPSGPMHLRIESVPAPPSRPPPPPPAAATSHESQINGGRPFIRVPQSPSPDPSSSSSPTTIPRTLLVQSVLANEHKETVLLFDEKEKEETHSHGTQPHFYEKMKDQQTVISQLMQQNAMIKKEWTEELQFNQYMNNKYGELYRHFVQLERMNRILLWDADNVISWILSLENGWFVKYKPMLSYHIKLRKMNGAMLSTLDQMDAYRLGVIDENDQCLLLNNIKALFHSNL